MLIRLIYKNWNIKNIAVYCLSVILSISLGTLSLFLYKMNQLTQLDENAANLDFIFVVFFVFAGLISVFFMLFSTGYYVKTKNRDYSILLMLGCSRKTMLNIFSVEFLLLFFMSTIIGILVGGLFSVPLQFILWIKKYSVSFQMADILWIIKSIGKIAVLLFVFEYLAAIIYLRKRDLSAMQLREVRKEKKHGWTAFLGFFGVVLIIYAMGLLNTLKNGNYILLYASMAVCLAGVYITMSFGGSLLLQIIQLFKGFYINHLLSLNEFYYKFKGNCKMMFMVFVLNFLVLFFTGGLFISEGPDDVESLEYPYGFVGVIEDEVQGEDVKKILGNGFEEIPAIKGCLEQKKSAQEYYCISNSDYNRLSGSQILLEPEEAILVNEGTAELEIPGLFQIAVVPDHLIGENRNQSATIIVKKGILSEECKRYYEDYPKNEPNIFWRSEFCENADRIMIFGQAIAFFIGTFCMLSCFEILTLKMLADKEFIIQKYQMLHYLGMSKKMISKNIRKEYRQILCIPIFLSVIMSSIYMGAEMNYSGMIQSGIILKYILFQATLLFIDMIYYFAIRKFILESIIQTELF